MIVPDENRDPGTLHRGDNPYVGGVANAFPHHLVERDLMAGRRGEGLAAHLREHLEDVHHRQIDSPLTSTGGSRQEVGLVLELERPGQKCPRG